MSEYQKYTVRFLIIKDVKVEELDEIQAELSAAEKLTPGQRKRVAMIQVLGVHSEPYSVDEEWWRERDLL